MQLLYFTVPCQWYCHANASNSSQGKAICTELQWTSAFFKAGGVVRPQIRGLSETSDTFGKWRKLMAKMPKITCATRAQFCATGCNFKKSPNSYTNSYSFCLAYVQVRPSTSILRPILALSSHHELKIAAGCANLHAFVAMWMVFGYLHIGRVVHMVRNHWPKVKESCHPTRQSHLWVLPASCQWSAMENEVTLT